MLGLLLLKQKMRIRRETGSNVAQSTARHRGSLLANSRRIRGFLINYKETGGADAAFVTFQQQRMSKAVVNTPNGQVGDCVTVPVLYFQPRKRGRLIVRLLETWGWGRERCSNGEKPRPDRNF